MEIVVITQDKAADLKMFCSSVETSEFVWRFWMKKNKLQYLILLVFQMHRFL